MTRQFMSVISEVLVKRYKVRVILTTHSPSTVALAPLDSLFEMSRDEPRIRRATSKQDTIGLLTAGLVIVSEGTRYVLVEDELDVSFYSKVRDILSDFGPSRDQKSLKPSPTIVFLPACLGEGKNKIGGGKNVVSQWVDKFDLPGLNEMVRGIVDRDEGNAPSKRTNVIGRYNIENYLLDPFVVYGILLSHGTAPAISEVKITQGDEHHLRTLNETQMQSIVNSIQGLIEPHLGQLSEQDAQSEKVTFTNGTSLDYPAWMIHGNGHALLPIYQKLFGGVGTISPPRLMESFARVRLVPVELANIMASIQH